MRVIDLFAGCGGLSLGLQQAGHEIVAAFEIDKFAGDTYERNHPAVSLVRRDIRELSSRYFAREFAGLVDLVAGGPPCQGFSVSGKRQYGIFSSQNELVFEFMRVVGALQPRLVLMENVGGFRTARINTKKPALAAVKRSLEDLGYHVYASVLQAADFGVPQYRTRIFIVGSRDALYVSPFPAPTHSRTGVLTPRHLSVLDAISDLPQIGAGRGTEELQPYPGPPLTPFQTILRLGSEGIANHVAMKHSSEIIRRFASIPPGGSGYNIGRSRHADNETVTVYKMNNQRLRGDLPSLCITANFQSNYVHPVLDRNLTAREAARIMSFPDSFVLKGKRTLMSSSLLKAEGRHEENHLSQYNQIGNAVPPLLAKKLGVQIAIAENPRSQEFTLGASETPVQPSLF
jgi:DNA (cytosine-5)-methyltransferase 1